MNIGDCARGVWDAFRTASVMLVCITVAAGTFVLWTEGSYRVADAKAVEASEAHAILDEIVADAVTRLLDGYAITLHSNLLLSRGQVWPLSYTHVALLRSLESAIEGKPTAWIKLLEGQALLADPRDPVGPLTIRSISLGLERWHAAGLNPSVQMYRILSFSSLASSATAKLDGLEGLRAGRSSGVCTAAPYVPGCIGRLLANATEDRSLRQRARQAHLEEHEDWSEAPTLPPLTEAPPKAPADQEI